MANKDQVFLRIKRQTFEQGHIVAQWIIDRQKQGVPIPLSLGDFCDTDVASCARLIVYHHGLPQRFREFFTKESGHEICGASCWVRYNEADGFGRVSLRMPCQAKQSREQSQGEGLDQLLHRVSWCVERFKRS